ncbi:hypothetical protein GOP47_0001562 [Adiantum capillus-veneris]|uniref:Uncharacterized protein n=1 Tax=Adiantum capillus-veneris TaxID=13818 RepID=A0A9D4ZND4_ADICA|nr:hypothetical protein GOP47_0001562 [Adiantum capillus-veneris]
MRLLFRVISTIDLDGRISLDQAFWTYGSISFHCCESGSTQQQLSMAMLTTWWITMPLHSPSYVPSLKLTATPPSLPSTLFHSRAIISLSTRQSFKEDLTIDMEPTSAVIGILLCNAATSLANTTVTLPVVMKQLVNQATDRLHME